jgi:hypothetical protein
MNGFDWAIVFPVIFKYVVVIVCLLALGCKVYLMNRTDNECEEMGYQRNIRG